MVSRCICFLLFFFNDTATTEIYTLSLHDALPICRWSSRSLILRAATPVGGGTQAGGTRGPQRVRHGAGAGQRQVGGGARADRKSTRLNSSHANISYAVFCLKKKKNT